MAYISAYYVIGQCFCITLTIQRLMSCSGIPFGIWLAFSWKQGIEGLWIGLTVSLVYCSVFGTMICLRTDWDREVWKVAERIKADVKAQTQYDEENR